MAADVSSLVRVINGGDSKESTSSGKSTAPITRDLLGGCSTPDSKELDLDLQVPCGWEKRLDLKSGKVYLQRCNSSNSSSSTSENKPQVSSKTLTKFQDLNFPPTSKQTLNLFDESSLELKLVSSSSTSPSSSSICTLDKVKSALERAEKETVIRKRAMSISMSKSCSPRSNSSSSIHDRDFDHEDRFSGSFAAGCPACLLYVLISKSNPRCPRCNSEVPLPVAVKKPRIDLNKCI
ncbi:hypothetical protein F511_28481 [Dorcoceras hygrometricum]|uniref:GIR1-like zinc ribbon domain-containing protein n=1 Tax=Dorcoceras hygrometricum TaxID=472368 RepID=A0A2Z7CNP9_9LAMI|nr:hypothetical protein F511_28481 [Dorcoceras hygrometricum]